MPGIGRINLAILLAEASGPLSRRDYQALKTLSGVAPVTKQSGKSRVVVRRCRWAGRDEGTSALIELRDCGKFRRPPSCRIRDQTPFGAARGCKRGQVACQRRLEWHDRGSGPAGAKRHSGCGSWDRVGLQRAPNDRLHHADGRVRRRAPRASAVQDAAKRHRRYAPARSVLDSASTVLFFVSREAQSTLARLAGSPPRQIHP